MKCFLRSGSAVPLLFGLLVFGLHGVAHGSPARISHLRGIDVSEANQANFYDLSVQRKKLSFWCYASPSTKRVRAGIVLSVASQARYIWIPLAKLAKSPLIQWGSSQKFSLRYGADKRTRVLLPLFRPSTKRQFKRRCGLLHGEDVGGDGWGFSPTRRPDSPFKNDSHDGGENGGDDGDSSTPPLSGNPPIDCDLDVHLTLQNDYLPNEVPAGSINPNLSNDAITVGGHWVLAGKDQNLNEFLSKTKDNVRNRFRQFVAQRLGPGKESVTLLVDIENPFEAHPNNWGEVSTVSPELFLQVINAISLRIEAIRELIPSTVKIALYAAGGVPNLRGNLTPSLEQRIRGYHLAALSGVYDQVDYAASILYIRSADFSPENPKDLSFVTAMTTLGIAMGSNIRDLNGRAIPILPVLGLYSGTKSDRDATHPEFLDLQLEILNTLRTSTNSPLSSAVHIWAGGYERDSLSRILSSQDLCRSNSDQSS
ncbi:MAG: hypothetical protein KDD64_12225 [Bdellovibrionales bacterium]|nr:hypothetical protein [Bdellovibrionales bacterium]